MAISDRYKFVMFRTDIGFQVDKFLGFNDLSYESEPVSKTYSSFVLACDSILLIIRPFLPDTMKPVPTCMKGLDSSRNHEFIVIYDTFNIVAVGARCFKEHPYNPNLIEEVDLLSLIPF